MLGVKIPPQERSEEDNELELRGECEGITYTPEDTR
jgi:hypothetical protein